MISKINSGLPTTTKIENLNDQILEVSGRVASAEFDVYELDQIFADSSMPRKFLRGQGIGNLTSTYTNWGHIKAESGYSIWKFTPNNYVHNDFNKIYIDDKAMVNKGQASSEAALGFDYVYLYNAEAPSGQVAYADNTSEATTELGTQFSLMDSTSDYLYVGLSSKFYGLALELYQRGSYYNLKVEYFNGSWTQLTSQTNGLIDKTNNFQGNGVITWNSSSVSSWTACSVNSQSKYWIRISSTQTPVTVAKAYWLVPNSSVIGMLALSSSEVLNEEWAFCSFGTSVYVTIRNAGNPAYEGNSFLTSTSTDTNKKNFFVYNHQITGDFQNVSYVGGSFSGYQAPANWTYSRTSVPTQLLDYAVGSSYIVAPVNTDISCSMKGFFQNTGNAGGSYGHCIGVMGYATDTSVGNMILYGTEGRVDGYGAAGMYYGVAGRGQWSDPASGNTTTYTGTVASINTQSCIYAYDKATARQQGVNVGAYIGSNTGGQFNYGIIVDTQTTGQFNIGVSIRSASTYTLQVGADVDGTVASKGIFFGTSGDTNLYRSAADTLKTDDSLIVGGVFTACSTNFTLDATGQITKINGTSVTAWNNANISFMTSGTALLNNNNATAGSGMSVCGGASVSSFLSIKSTSGTGTSDYIKFVCGSNGATEAMRVITSGNVGINTATPYAKLDVAGGVRLANARYATGTVVTNATAALTLTGANLAKGAICSSRSVENCSTVKLAMTEPTRVACLSAVTSIRSIQAR